MNCYSPGSEIIDSEHAADNIPAHVVKDQDLPDRVAIFVEDGGRNEALCRCLVAGILRGIGVVV
jgi:hypothetical protein